MKRGDLLRYLQGCGCKLEREGSRHSIYLNPANGKKTSLPRHMEIDNAWRAKSANSSMFRQSARESASRRLCLVTARDGSVKAK